MYQHREMIEQAPQHQLTTVAMSEDAKDYAGASVAKNTRRAYKSALKEFEKFCKARGESALPAGPETLCEYFTWRAKHDKSSTLQVKRAAIVAAHKAAGLVDPTSHPAVETVLSGIRREIGAPAVKKSAITPNQLLAIVSALPDSLTGKRDRALILVGFAGAFRRSELVAVDMADLHFNSALKILVRKSKTDQNGAGQVKSIPPTPGDLDAVQALRDWLEAAAIESGPVFLAVDQWSNLGERLSAQTVNRILKRAVKTVGLDPRAFGGHSLRSGFISAAIDGGASEVDIMEQTFHADVRVLRGYVQRAGRGASRAVHAALTGRAEARTEKEW